MCSGEDQCCFSEMIGMYHNCWYVSLFQLFESSVIRICTWWPRKWLRTRSSLLHFPATSDYSQYWSCRVTIRKLVSWLHMPCLQRRSFPSDDLVVSCLQIWNYLYISAMQTSFANGGWDLNSLEIKTTGRIHVKWIEWVMTICSQETCCRR